MGIQSLATRLFVSAIVGTGVAAGLAYVDQHRDLGIVYDSLLAHRPSPSYPRDLLLIETTPSDLAASDWSASVALEQVLTTMTEFRARRALVQFPLSADGRNFDEEGLDQTRQEFDAEFGTITRNISTLFDAIKLGSIRPRDSAAYVARLTSLVDEAKERLIGSIEKGELNGIARFEAASSVFGNTWIATDASEVLPKPGSVAGTGSSTLPKDGDGKLRRAWLQDPSTGERNFVAAAFSTEGIEAPRPMRNQSESGEGQDRVGSGLPWEELLIDPPRADKGGVRRVSFDAFQRYAVAEKRLYQHLKDMGKKGYFDALDPAAYPTSTWEYSESLKRDLLAMDKGPRLANARDEWRESRDRFADSVAKLLGGDAEMALEQGYKNILSSEGLEAGGKEKIEQLRTSTRRDFGNARIYYGEFAELRAALEGSLRDSVCLIGYARLAAATDSTTAKGRMEGKSRQLSDLEASAILATDLKTGSFLYRGSLGAAIKVGVVGVLAISLATAAIPWGLALAVGCLLSILTGLGLAGYFIYTGFWISPIISALGGLAATLCSATLGGAISARRKAPLRRVFAHRVPKRMLSDLMQRGDKAALSMRTAEVAILAIRAPGLTKRGDDSKEDPFLPLNDFATQVAKIVTGEDGIVLNMDGDLIFAAFGLRLSLDRGGRRRQKKETSTEAHALMALRTARSLAKTPGPTALRFGLDVGLCRFGVIDPKGLASYTALGAAIVRARLLSGLSNRYGGWLLVTEDAKRALGDSIRFRALDKLVERDAGVEIPFYDLQEPLP